MSKFTVGQKIRHVKTGRQYTLIADPSSALMKISETEWVPAYVYEIGGHVFIRSATEMESGRFEREEQGSE